MIIIKHPLFDNSVLVVILMNSIVLCLDKPTDPTETPTIKALNDFFLWFYLAECLLKVTGIIIFNNLNNYYLAMGFIFSKKGYIRDRNFFIFLIF